MEKKQTAVEWLEDKISTATNDELTDNIAAWFNSAKIMEEQQIIDAHIHGQFKVIEAKREFAQKYFNDFYGGNNE